MIFLAGSSSVTKVMEVPCRIPQVVKNIYIHMSAIVGGIFIEM